MPLRIALAVLIGLAADSCLAAAGFYNKPTTLPQCLGVGYGPGYHATMILKPYYRTWNAGRGVVRAQPHQYPPIYQKHSARAFDAPSQLPQATVYRQPYYRQAPLPHAVQVGPVFAPPVVHSVGKPSTAGRPQPEPQAEIVPAEPSSPSDTPKPDRLPMPGRES